MEPQHHPSDHLLRRSSIPKNTEQDMPQTAPPPYTPPCCPTLTGLAARGARLSSLSHRPVQGESRLLLRPLTTTTHLEDIDQAAGEEGPVALSPLSLRINTSISITKGNNLVCLTESPASHANAIAEAVARAIHKNSSGGCGIPMIDGNGNPRPVRIEVDAGMVVDGVGNVVGNEGIIEEVLRQRADLRRMDLRRQRDDENGSEPEPETSKRRRSE